MTPRPLPFLALATFGWLVGCTGLDGPAGEPDGGTAPSGSATYRYHREYVFVAPRPDDPIVVPFAFRTVERGAELERVTRGWLARGAAWDPFLADTTLTSRSGGVWRLVPQGDLRVNAGGAAEIESLRFQRGERRLRLDFETPLTPWNQAGDTRFRVVEGRLTLGQETARGPILEILGVERTLADGWPPGQDFDALFLTTGDSIQLLLADPVPGSDDPDVGYAWSRIGARERTWASGEIQWIEMRTYEEARREVPQRWSFRIPGTELHGEVEAVGFDGILGPERGGRRAIEIRYTVTGWMEFAGGTEPVVGMIRHTQQ